MSKALIMSVVIFMSTLTVQANSFDRVAAEAVFQNYFNQNYCNYAKQKFYCDGEIFYYLKLGEEKGTWEINWNPQSYAHELLVLYPDGSIMASYYEED